MVLVVTTGTDHAEYLVWCVREADGWHDAGGGSAAEHWGLTDEENDLGRLAGWGRARLTDVGELSIVRRCKFRTLGPDRCSSPTRWLREVSGGLDTSDSVTDHTVARGN